MYTLAPNFDAEELGLADLGPAVRRVRVARQVFFVECIVGVPVDAGITPALGLGHEVLVDFDDGGQHDEVLAVECAELALMLPSRVVFGYCGHAGRVGSNKQVRCVGFANDSRGLVTPKAGRACSG